jgi:hypothetical protein
MILLGAVARLWSSTCALPCPPPVTQSYFPDPHPPTSPLSLPKLATPSTHTSLLSHVTRFLQEVFMWQLLANSSQFFPCASVSWACVRGLRLCPDDYSSPPPPPGMRTPPPTQPYVWMYWARLFGSLPQATFLGMFMDRVTETVNHATDGIPFALYSAPTQGALSFLLSTCPVSGCGNKGASRHACVACPSLLPPPPTPCTPLLSSCTGHRHQRPAPLRQRAGVRGVH